MTEPIDLLKPLSSCKKIIPDSGREIWRSGGGGRIVIRRIRQLRHYDTLRNESWTIIDTYTLG